MRLQTIDYVVLYKKKYHLTYFFCFLFQVFADVKAILDKED